MTTDSGQSDTPMADRLRDDPDHEGWRELAYLVAGAVAGAFMKEHPTMVMPTERIKEAVESILSAVGVEG